MRFGIGCFLMAAAVLLSGHASVSAEATFVPHLVGTNDDPVCRIILQHYTRLFESQIQESNANVESDQIIHPEMQSVNFAKYGQTLHLSDVKFQGEPRVIVYEEHMVRYDHEVFDIFVVKHDDIFEFAKQLSEGGTYDDEHPLSSLSFISTSMNLDNVFIFSYLDRWYALADPTVFLDDDGIRIVHELKASGRAGEACQIQVFKKFEPDNPPPGLIFYAAYVRLLEGIMGSHCCFAGRRTGRQQASAAVYRPWAAARSWAYVSPDGPSYSSHNRLPERAAHDRLEFERWQYSDAWSFRQFGALTAARDAAVQDLKEHYRTQFAKDGPTAEAMARDIVDALPAAYSQFSPDSQYSPEPDNEKSVRFLEELVQGSFADWPDLKRLLKRRSYPLPNAVLSVAVDAPQILRNPENPINLLEVKTNYGKDMLMFAAHMNNFDAAEDLVRAGWPLDRVTHEAPADNWDIRVRRTNRSALTYAVENASIELIELLVAAGADIAIRDSEGKNLDYYIRLNPRFSNQDKALGLEGVLRKYTPTGPVAPSFRCRDGLDRIAAAICASRGLSIYDRELDAGYQQLMGQQALAERLRSIQETWIRARDRECGSFAAPAQLAACIARSTRARIRYLESLGSVRSAS